MIKNISTTKINPSFCARFYSSEYIKLLEPMYVTRGFKDKETLLSDEFSKETAKDKDYALVMSTYNDSDDETIFKLYRGKPNCEDIVAQGEFDFLDDPKNYNIETLMSVYNKLRKQGKLNEAILKEDIRHKNAIKKLREKYSE